MISLDKSLKANKFTILLHHLRTVISTPLPVSVGGRVVFIQQCAPSGSYFVSFWLERRVVV